MVLLVFLIGFSVGYASWKGFPIQQHELNSGEPYKVIFIRQKQAVGGDDDNGGTTYLVLEDRERLWKPYEARTLNLPGGLSEGNYITTIKGKGSKEKIVIYTPP